jgi:hypothetical protein
MAASATAFAMAFTTVFAPATTTATTTAFAPATITTSARLSPVPLYPV